MFLHSTTRSLRRMAALNFAAADASASASPVRSRDAHVDALLFEPVLGLVDEVALRQRQSHGQAALVESTFSISPFSTCSRSAMLRHHSVGAQEERVGVCGVAGTLLQCCCCFCCLYVSSLFPLPLPPAAPAAPSVPSEAVSVVGRRCDGSMCTSRPITMRWFSGSQRMLGM